MTTNQIPPDWRRLCEELVNELEFWRSLGEVPDCLARARAALAQSESEPVGPTDAELALNELERIVVLLMPITGHKKIKRFDTIRAALKRLQELESKADHGCSWDTIPATAPAGEVAEAIADLRECADSCILSSKPYWAGPMRRAADLLERQAVPVPVPVSERPWEREGWCDDEGRCWAFNEHLTAWEFLPCIDSRKWADLFLPVHAFPLPSDTESGDSNE